MRSASEPWRESRLDPTRRRFPPADPALLLLSKFASMVTYVTNEKLDVFTKRMELIGIADPAFWTRFGVHYGLFLGAIRSGASANQFSYWLEKGVLGLNGMVGCFAMTELAHVSRLPRPSLS